MYYYEKCQTFRKVEFYSEHPYAHWAGFYNEHLSIFALLHKYPSLHQYIFYVLIHFRVVDINTFYP